MQGFQFEKAVKVLIKYFPEEKMKKPTLFHSIRVGTFLWNKNYSEEIQIAWLLHDSLEDTFIPEKIISDFFWDNVLQIVKANSKNMNLETSEILEDIILRCSKYSQDALIVKIADVYDNFLFYKKTENLPEIERCKTLAKLINIHKKAEYTNWIFNLCHEIIEY